MDFDLIYQTYFKDVFLYTYSLSADEHIAEEITQEAFTKALKSFFPYTLMDLSAMIREIWLQDIWKVAKSAAKSMTP